MTKDKDIKMVVPTLRFPEFRNSEEWEIKPFGIMADVIKGQQLNAIELETMGEYPCLNGGMQPSGFTNDYNTIENTITISEGGSSCGYVNFVETKFWCGGHCYAVSIKNKSIDKMFFFQYLKGNESKIMALRIGSGLPNIQKKSILEFVVCIPNTNFEQQKIADCLSSVDELISAETDKIDQLKAYKKGLMQRLFPAEDKTVPILRFKEFQNAEEWQETTLGEEVYYENGKAHENDIDETGQYIVVNSKFISTDGEVVKYTDNPYCLAERGDILMVLSDVPNGRAIAKCFVVSCDDKYTVNQRICKLKPKKAIGLLLYYIINRNSFLLAFDDGIKQTNLKKNTVLNCPFRLPKKAEEQRRIANSLSSIDELISAETDIIDQLKAHKKGLMQRLFPTLK